MMNPTQSSRRGDLSPRRVLTARRAVVTAAIALTGLVALTTAGEAQLSQPGRTVLATNDATVSVSDDPGVVSDILFEPNGEQSVRVTNNAGALFIRPGALGCINETPSTVTCPTMDVLQLIVNAGDGDDKVKVITRDDQKLPNVLAYLEDGNDTFENDSPNGGARANVKGGLGDDTIIGGAGLDMLSGEDGNDRLIGNQGRDIIRGSVGDDYIRGGTDCVDNCDGEADNDSLNGGPGNDDLAGGSGRDKFFGGTGNDTFRGIDDGDIDQVNGGPGNDTLRGVDFNKRTYRFTDQLQRLEKVFPATAGKSGSWTCEKARCLVQPKGRNKPLRVRLY